jgi:hypothetical protein
VRFEKHPRELLLKKVPYKDISQTCLKNWGWFFIFDMQAYRIHKIVIAADTREEACAFYREEIGGTLP